MIQTRQSSGAQPESLREPDRVAELRASLIIEIEKQSQLERQLLEDGELREKESNREPTPVVPAAPAVPVVPTAPIPQHYISQELMDQRIREIIEATALNTKDDSHKIQGSPIAKELFDMNIPTGFHAPKIIKYKGTDPGQHIQQFHDSLEGLIHTFEQLQKIFIKAYAHNKDKEENLYSLISLKQTHGEKLEDFSKKFLELARKVDNQDQKTAVSAFTNALQFNCKAKEYLFLKKPKTLKDMIEKVNNYIDLERMMPELSKPAKAVHNTKAPSTDFNNNRSSSEPGDLKRAKIEPERDNNKRSQKPSRTVIPKLNAKLSEIYPILQKDKCFRPARHLDPIAGQPHCEYHRINHHKTDNCNGLKKLLEIIFKEGGCTNTSSIFQAIKTGAI
ncbi:hypothetical protein GIB67_032610 [Kingdonia uniflora]|uniref:Retrotransposon gag domain-containing protein n=1 Tax=Kingdonia uniflora TaxID=39325 RepID=A0A7J7L4Z8_9MAGN|nr:hypothetical protein GIB67_032610 [Kingdonia uniflora]